MLGGSTGRRITYTLILCRDFGRDYRPTLLSIARWAQAVATLPVCRAFFEKLYKQWNLNLD